MEKEKVKGRVKAKGTWAVSDLIVIVLQLIATTVFAYLINKVLPLKYWFIVVLLLAAAAVFVIAKIASYVKQLALYKGKKLSFYVGRKKLIVKIFSVILSAILVIVSLYAGKGLGALDSITGENHQTHLINIVVMADSPYEKINDLAGKTIGIAEGIDKENTDKLLDEIQNKEKVDADTAGFDSVVALAEALLNGEVEAILLNEAYRGLIEDQYGTFTNDTRILYDFEVKEELKREEKNVDVTEEAFNIYISGIDTYGKVSTVSRSDVNMIVTVNPKTKQILMTSIPRDYYVELASFGVKDKLTHAGIYGVEESMATLEKEFGITLHYYARVNFTSLIKIVNALGGINVYNDQSFTSYHTHDYYPKGEMYMDGETALEFVRERYGLANGDHDRVKNQQKVLTAMLKKAMSPSIIKNYGKLMDAVSGSFTTNMDAKEIQSLIQMQVDDMASWNFEQISVNGTGTKSTSCYSMPGQSVYVMKPDYDTVNNAIERINSVLRGE